MMADLDAAHLAELVADNRRLRRLLEQRDAPGELRHRLRGTLALLRAIIRRSAETPRALPDYVAHLEDRLDAVARAQALADQHGDVDLRTLLADQLLQYGASEDGALSLTGPDLRLRPRVGQVLALAFHELAVNAVEHGALGASDGRVDVAWTVSAETSGPVLRMTWTERAAIIGGDGPVREGFGTDVLAHMLGYELGAETRRSVEPGGLCWTIRLPLTTRVGDVVTD